MMLMMQGASTLGWMGAAVSKECQMIWCLKRQAAAAAAGKKRVGVTAMRGRRRGQRAGKRRVQHTAMVPAAVAGTAMVSATGLP
jgi:hypothetical protein